MFLQYLSVISEVLVENIVYGCDDISRGQLCSHVIHWIASVCIVYCDLVVIASVDILYPPQAGLCYSVGHSDVIKYLSGWIQGSVALWDICLKSILNSNLMKSDFAITCCSDVRSFWNYSQSTAVSLPCSVQNFKTIWLLKLMLWTDKFLWALPRSLTHWGRVMHICVSNLAIIGSDNGLSPGQRQAIIWTNAGIFLIKPLGTNFSEILIENHIFSYKKMRLKLSSVKWRPFCLGLNVLMLIHRLRPGHNGGHFADNIFRSGSLFNENDLCDLFRLKYILIITSLKFAS